MGVINATKLLAEDLGDWAARPDLACLTADVDPEVFFPEKGARTSNAKAICYQCPALVECRAWALDQNPYGLYGVWGGLNRDDRLAHAGKRRR